MGSLGKIGGGRTLVVILGALGLLSAGRATAMAHGEQVAAPGLAPRYLEIHIDRPIGSGPSLDGRWPLWSQPVIKTIDLAISRGVEHVVFVLDTPGGSVVEVRAIAHAISERSGKVRFHAYVRKALSAGIWIALTCDDIWVEPNATIGAAVAYSRGRGTGEISVDEKLNSALAAELGALIQSKGRCPDIPRAMISMGAELWTALDTDGNRVFSGSPPQSGKEIRRLDSADTVLTLTGPEMEALGIAKAVSGVTQLAHKQGWARDSHAFFVIEQLDCCFKSPWVKAGVIDGSLRRKRTSLRQDSLEFYLFQEPPEDPSTLVLRVGDALPDVNKKPNFAAANRAWEQIVRAVAVLYERDPLLLSLADKATPDARLKEFAKRKSECTAAWQRISNSFKKIRESGWPTMSGEAGGIAMARIQTEWKALEAQLGEAVERSKAKSASTP
jgi:hypothetical protein